MWRLFRTVDKKYLLKHAGLFAVVIVEGAAVVLMTYNIPITLPWLALRAVIWATVPLAINLLIYFRNPHFREMCGYFKNLMMTVLKKVKNK